VFAIHSPEQLDNWGMLEVVVPLAKWNRLYANLGHLSTDDPKRYQATRDP
jgi:hypothetical protein